MTTFLTVEEAAALLRLKEATIRTYVREGKLSAKRPLGCKQVLIEERDLLGLLGDARTEGETPAATGASEVPTARALMRMTREQRRPFLEASAEAALPLYAADLARPERERELTADLETGDIYDEIGVPANA